MYVQKTNINWRYCVGLSTQHDPSSLSTTNLNSDAFTAVLLTQARTQPFSKGGSIRGVSQTMSAFMLWALTHTPPRGVWGHAPPEIFGNLDFLRAIPRHSDSHYHSLPPQFTFMMSS